MTLSHHITQKALGSVPRAVASAACREVYLRKPRSLPLVVLIRRDDLIVLLLSTTLNVAYGYIKPSPQPATVKELQKRIMLEYKYMCLLRTLAYLAYSVFHPFKFDT